MAAAWNGSPIAPPAAINSRLFISAIRSSFLKSIAPALLSIFRYSGLLLRVKPSSPRRGCVPLVDGWRILVESEPYGECRDRLGARSACCVPGALGDHRVVEPGNDSCICVALQPVRGPRGARLHQV